DSFSSSVSVLSKPIIIDNLITDNKIGIDLYQASAIINHNTISYNNHYKTYLGATFGIYIKDSSAKISNNIITDSGICDLCAGINVDEESKDIVLKYNNIWNNKNNFVCFGKCVMEDNNFSEDPMFVDYINGDYKLSEESGLIGKSEKGLDIGIRWE
ncbi:right-handed parallel beta-helix repeat-containing protein, partial [Candidatus Parcubacteria bacterium]|nr:right-handed parallel beta-helix repeat-containing protein [Candidatus Parcubacteria bacterium]